jgi:hypothetical protein
MGVPPAQVLSLVEQFLLMYRTVATVPCWLLYFHSLAMGDILTSGMHGAPRACAGMQLPAQTFINQTYGHHSRCALSCFKPWLCMGAACS